MIRMVNTIEARAFPDNGVLSLIGNTPLLKLERIVSQNRFNLYGKLEMYNPGSSIKDRTALSMIKEAWKRGDINEDTTIIESSSGNLAVGLAQLANYLGLRFICVLDPKTNQQTIKVLRAYGAIIDMVNEPDPVTGEYLQARINRVSWLKENTPNSFWCNQYANLDNPLAHRHLMNEIMTVLHGQIDYLFLSVSTCGTFRGCFEYIQQHGLNTKIVAVDAQGSVIFGDKGRAKRLIPGHGAARVPELFQPGMEYQQVHVTDMECVEGCRLLLQRESILAGGSSGAIIMAIKRLEAEISDNSTCVAILADSGERYMDTVYSEEWVQSHLKGVQIDE
ncbi:2,3-diaminopropionate biosynthesis protein SbnA [Paenibacillus sp. ACRRX]|uniref:2,3-diaminopropionate biosynthesis protein SbnA n=2 Tax=unclassified Paenibacillus TaxID=185978 RepID=UPI00254B5DA5|nr:2,3-diaminopropionate biosynthesis protein SbnA [Paenibacillus sp. UMB4589-SE434]MCG7409121.1 2,3-diaminopropionate biosynthesis protein SbnA [Paenibacillus sp. ACRRX]MDK8181885.1 2,3-diaminopropionate biosynthesis protein SbnA [Paenibacillus sp. UMB4589-SE434]